VSCKKVEVVAVAVEVVGVAASAAGGSATRPLPVVGMVLLSRRYLHRAVRLSTLHMVDIRVQAKRLKYQMEELVLLSGKLGKLSGISNFSQEQRFK
jgi:hypothetical protein